MTTTEKAESVTNRQEFVEFLKGLENDLRTNPSEWGHTDLKGFLNAFGAWVEDMDGYFLNRGTTPPKNPDWTLMAQMFAAAKVYE
jgi:hypothetical protein